MARKLTDARKLAEHVRELDRLYWLWDEARDAYLRSEPASAEAHRLQRLARARWRRYMRLRDTSY